MSRRNMLLPSTTLNLVSGKELEKRLMINAHLFEEAKLVPLLNLLLPKAASRQESGKPLTPGA